MLNAIQRGLQRRQIRITLEDPSLIQTLAAPLDRQVAIMLKGATEADVASAMSTNDFTAMSATVANGLVKNEGMDANTVTTSPLLALIQQLLASLLPMLLACIPAAAPATSPTPAQVIAAIQ